MEYQFLRNVGCPLNNLAFSENFTRTHATKTTVNLNGTFRKLLHIIEEYPCCHCTSISNTVSPIPSYTSAHNTFLSEFSHPSTDIRKHLMIPCSSLSNNNSCPHWTLKLLVPLYSLLKFHYFSDSPHVSGLRPVLNSIPRGIQFILKKTPRFAIPVTKKSRGASLFSKWVRQEFGVPIKYLKLISCCFPFLFFLFFKV